MKHLQLLLLQLLLLLATLRYFCTYRYLQCTYINCLDLENEGKRQNVMYLYLPTYFLYYNVPNKRACTFIRHIRVH